MPVLWWVKQDFRLADNPALRAALAEAEARRTTVLPVYCFEPTILHVEETGPLHVAAWGEALADLRVRLRQYGGDILVLHADAPEAFDRLRDTLSSEGGIAAIHAHEEYGSALTCTRDTAVRRWAKGHGIALHEHRQTGVFRPLPNRDARRTLWRRFTDGGPLAAPSPEHLRRIRVPAAARALAAPAAALLDNPSEAPVAVAAAFGHAVTEAQQSHRQPVSETAAQATLDDFLHRRGLCYSGGISSPNTAFRCGSRLSVHLAWGTLTGRQAYAATEQRILELAQIGHPDAGRWRTSLRSFLSRLHWRDHFVQRLESEPQMEVAPLNAAYAALPTPGDAHLDAWLAGQTGWPLVDACMRCLDATGFLNFRMRAMVTSAAVHSLRIGWRTTLYPLARRWADYVPGIHIAQTQMQAGVVGINQLRVYSPNKQLADHDPEARFVKQWVPELADAPPEAILQHHERPVEAYPAPLVDWWASSKAMKDDYYAIKRLPETKALAEAVYARHGSRRAPSSRTWKSNGPRKTKRAAKPVPEPAPKPPKQPGPAPLFGDE
ncbi:MAG: FAD-binding domain-containing protein [Bacteroidota bacterium]